MCLVLPARVIAADGVSAEIELHDGQRVVASTELTPNLQVGVYVLVDRGMVLKVIEPDEAEAILAIYAEMSDMLEADDPVTPELAAWPLAESAR